MDDVSEPHIERFTRHRLHGAAPAGVVVAQTRQGAVIALDGATGDPLWRWATGDRTVSVAQRGEQVYVSAATSDRPYKVEIDPIPSVQPQMRIPRISVRLSALTALGARDGRIRWRMTFYRPDEVERLHLAGSAIILSVISFESQAKEVIALDAATGALRWSKRIGAPLPPSVRPRLLWADESRVVVIMEAKAGEGDKGVEGSFALLDAATGALISRSDQPPPNARALRRQRWGDYVFSRDDGHAWPHAFINAVRSSDGAGVWRIACDGVAGHPPASMDLLADDGRVYLLSCSTYVVRAHALDAATGQIIWRWRSPRWLVTAFLLRQALQRAREARQNGAWRAFWGDALRLRWRRPLRPEGDPALDAADGQVYVATYLGAFALRAHDGRQRWHALPFVVVNRIPPIG